MRNYLGCLKQILGSFLFASICLSSSSHAYPVCELGKIDCNLLPQSAIEVPVSLKLGLRYKCTIKSTSSKTLTGKISGADGYRYSKINFSVDSSGREYVIDGFFYQPEGKIIIENTSNENGQVTCKK